MKHLVALLLLACLVVSSTAAELPDCFLGRWRSDEALTLADMHKHPEVSAKARAMFENSFFGKLVIVNTRKRGAAYLEPYQSRESMVFEPFDIVSSTETWVTMRGSYKNTEWFCESGHIYALVSRWNFREYFSPE